MQPVPVDLCMYCGSLPVEKYASTVVVARATILGYRGGIWDCGLWVVAEVPISCGWMWV